MVFIDLTLYLPGRNHNSLAISEQFICTDSHEVHKLYQTLQIMASSRLRKERLSNFSSVVQTIFFKEIFLLTIFFIDFLYADNLFYQNGNPPVEK